jgi:hypothetical protein
MLTLFRNEVNSIWKLGVVAHIFREREIVRKISDFLFNCTHIFIVFALKKKRLTNYEDKGIQQPGLPSHYLYRPTRISLMIN